MNNPERQHTVPKFYLRGFAQHDKIRVIDLQKNSIYLSSVNKASIIKNFYTIDQGTDKFAFEKALGNVEAAAAQAFNSVKMGSWPLSLEDRVSLAVFMAISLLRGITFRNFLSQADGFFTKLITEDSSDHSITSYLNNIGSDSLSEDTISTIRNTIADEGDLGIIDANRHLTHIPNLAVRLAFNILERNWALATSTDRNFLTGDTPLISTRNTKAGLELCGVLHAENIAFPISRNQAIFTGPVTNPTLALSSCLDYRFDCDTAFADTLNETVLFSSFDRLYLHPEDEELIPDKELLLLHEPPAIDFTSVRLPIMPHY